MRTRSPRPRARRRERASATKPGSSWRSDAGGACTQIIPTGAQRRWLGALGFCAVVAAAHLSGLDPLVAGTVAYGGALSAFAACGSGLW